MARSSHPKKEIEAALRRVVAMADVKAAIPGATLVEAAPDFVGLSDVAQVLSWLQAKGGFLLPKMLQIWRLAQANPFRTCRTVENTV